jgi:hypothetical protein
MNEPLNREKFALNLYDICNMVNLDETLIESFCLHRYFKEEIKTALVRKKFFNSIF